MNGIIFLYKTVVFVVQDAIITFILVQDTSTISPTPRPCVAPGESTHALAASAPRGKPDHVHYPKRRICTKTKLDE
jgi:hypothetical protein